jgi:hypothetical protein
MAIKPGVLFLCTENSCRTQMAEAYLRELVGESIRDRERGSRSGSLGPRRSSCDARSGYRHLVCEDQRVPAGSWPGKALTPMRSHRRLKARFYPRGETGLEGVLWPDVL